MIYCVSFSLAPDRGEEDFLPETARVLGVAEKAIERLDLYRKALDARKGKILWHYTFHVTLKRGVTPKKSAKVTVIKEEYRYTIPRVSAPRPVVVGFGPAGIFVGLVLARAGLCPIVIERGKPVDARVKDVADFFAGGKLDEESNVLFGEGGAGTFSDGKLNTLLKDRNARGRFVLQTLVEAGAPSEILTQSRPHVGTDRLRGAVKNVREMICNLGGEVRFETRLVSLTAEGEHLSGAVVEHGGVLETIPCRALFLAIGHSARDTFQQLEKLSIPMEKKIFSVGVRIEHLQKKINKAQYGSAHERYALPPASYKLAVPTSGGKTLYTFCMCPGGVVVPAAGEAGGVVTNGMSNFARDAENANAALLLNVLPEETGAGIFSGFDFQRNLEQKAFVAGGGEYRAPCQLCGDFLQKRESHTFGDVLPSYARKTAFAPLDDILPPAFCDMMREGIVKMGKLLSGFDAPDAVLTGVESRATCPVRIVRGEDYQSALRGLYPIGEGAGYAGGILSSAMDGMRAVEAYFDLIKEKQ